MWCLCLGLGTCGSTFRSQSHLQGANDFTTPGWADEEMHISQDFFGWNKSPKENVKCWWQTILYIYYLCMYIYIYININMHVLTLAAGSLTYHYNVV